MGVNYVPSYPYNGVPMQGRQYIIPVNEIQQMQGKRIRTTVPNIAGTITATVGTYNASTNRVELINIISDRTGVSYGNLSYLPEELSGLQVIGDGPQEGDIADKVVIACISGRGGVAGTGRGMVQLRDKLQDELQSLGIKRDNIFRRSWNHNQDDNPLGAPWVEDLLREIDRRSKNPSYLAIIGHSYGGWAACKLSRVTSRVPDFVGLIDPVFGSTNTFTNGDIPRGKFIKNWYQNNSPFGIEPCTGVGVPCSPATNGISCGYQNVPGAHENVNEHFLKDWEGNRKRVSCGVGPRRHLLTSHVNIDEDQWIHRQIRDQIYNDLSKLIGVRQTGELTAP